MKFIRKYHYLLIACTFIIIFIFYAYFWELAIRQKVTVEYLKSIFTNFSFIALMLIFLPNIKSIIKNYQSDLLIFCYCFLLEVIFILTSGLELTPLFFFALFFTLYLGFLLISLLPIKIKRYLHYFVIVIFPLYLIIQTIYVTIFNDFFSVVEVVTLKEGLDFAEGVISFNFIFILYLIIALVMVFIYRKTKTERIIIGYKSYLNLIPLLLLVILNLQLPVKQARMHTSDRYLYKEVFSHSKFISRFGALNYIIRDGFKLIEPVIIPKPDYTNEIDQYFKKNPKEHQTNEYTGIFAGKNLIFIMAESLDHLALNETLTPNIYRLQTEGWNFTNHFIPVFPRTTCDSEIIYNTSIIPSLTDGPTCYVFNQNSYQYSLANLFKQQDYLTQAFHSNSIEFYTRNIVYKGLGYDEFYDQKRLGLTDHEKRYDSIFYKKGSPYFYPDGNFMNFVITLSGHSPYEDTHLTAQKHLPTVTNYFNQKKEKVPDTVMAYMATQIELDLYLKLLWEDLEKNNHLDDTVILLTADHYPYTLKKKVYEKYTLIKEQYLKNRSPLIIWQKDLEPMVYEELTQSFDLLPTLANLFNLETNYTYYFGNDIFDPNRFPITYFKDYSWFDGTNYAKHNDLISGTGCPKYIDNTATKINEYYDISIKILRSNYFKTK